MAYGTETVPRVDKVLGPGNLFVVLAKQARLRRGHRPAPRPHGDPRSGGRIGRSGRGGRPAGPGGARPPGHPAPADHLRGPGQRAQGAVERQLESLPTAATARDLGLRGGAVVVRASKRPSGWPTPTPRSTSASCCETPGPTWGCATPASSSAAPPPKRGRLRRRSQPHHAHRGHRPLRLAPLRGRLREDHQRGRPPRGAPGPDRPHRARLARAEGFEAHARAGGTPFPSPSRRRRPC